jgi:HEAT repeat protein
VLVAPAPGEIGHGLWRGNGSREEKEKLKTGKLLSDLCSQDESVKWAAVTALGGFVSELAETDPEAARNWMRRFMWQLNEESGGIGWGIPEVMGEVMARHEGLAREFFRILLSYLDEDGNYLEFEPLQRGVLWGLGRLAQVRPELLKSCSAVHFVEPFLHSPDDPLRGLTVWVLGWIGNPQSLPQIRNLRKDPAEISLFTNNSLQLRSIQDLAEEAIEKIRS